MLLRHRAICSDSDDQLNSFSVQVHYYTKLIEKKPEWELVEIYADEGISGTSTEKRDDFNRMVEDCRKGKIDRIITKSTSRFARNTLDTIRIIRELKSLGVTVFFEKENLDTALLTSENLLTLYATFAQEESLSISQNCKKGNRMRMQRGEYVSSNPAYGYRLVNNQLEIYVPEAKIVRRIFVEYLAGKGTASIAADLMKDNIPRKNGNVKWYSTTIAFILRNERYIGDMLLQKSYNEDVIPYRKNMNCGQLPQYYVKGTHEPIISPIQFELANLLLKQNSEMTKKRVRGNHPLTGKIRCSQCESLYRRKNTNDKIYWTCRVHDTNKSYCSAERILEEQIYRAFVRMFNKLKKGQASILLPMLSQLERLREAGTRGNIELNQINKQIADLSEQSHVMVGLVSKGILDSALFISQTDELKRKIRSLKQTKARLMGENPVDGILQKTQELIDILDSGPDYIREMDESLLDEMVDHIIAYDKESIDFELINGLRLTERLG